MFASWPAARAQAPTVAPYVVVADAITGAGAVAGAGAEAVAVVVAPAQAVAGRVRAVHIHRATFLAPFAPGDTMTLHAQVVDADEWTMVAAGQAWNRDTLAAFAVSEVYLDE